MGIFLVCQNRCAPKDSVVHAIHLFAAIKPPPMLHILQKLTIFRQCVIDKVNGHLINTCSKEYELCALDVFAILSLIVNIIGGGGFSEK